MAIRKLILDRVPNRDEVMTVNKSGLAWGAKFVRNNELQNMASISFHVDDEDPYWLGFTFHDEENVRGALMVSNRRNSANLSLKAGLLFKTHSVLRKIQKIEDYSQRVFPINFDKKTKIYYVEMRPCFESSLAIESIGKISDDLIGIYRYLYKNEIVYIGRGNLKERSSSRERDDWQADRFEYSALSNKEECVTWEGYYIDKFLEAEGRLPIYNLVAGKGRE
jgi:hypothetical protein